MFNKNNLTFKGLNNTLHILSDPNRRKILEILKEKGSSSVSRIADHFSITLPSLSHHLTVLKNAKLVRTQRHGQEIHYSLNQTVYGRVIRGLSLFLEGLSPNI